MSSPSREPLTYHRPLTWRQGTGENVVPSHHVAIGAAVRRHQLGAGRGYPPLTPLPLRQTAWHPPRNHPPALKRTPLPWRRPVRRVLCSFLLRLGLRTAPTQDQGALGSTR